MIEKKILFLVDHKHRDLIGHSLIAYFLRNKGHKVFLRRLHENETGLIRPDVIIENKLGRNLKYQKRINNWKKQNIKIILIENEGINQWSDSKKKISFKPDLALFWNKNHGHIENDYFNKEIVGSPRTDFLLKEYRSIFKKKSEIMKAYNINPNYKTITIATHNSYEDLSQNKLKEMAKTRKYIYEENHTFMDLVEHQKQARKSILNFVEEIINESTNCNIVVKPHPNDDINFWKKYKKKNPQVILMIGAPINDLFCVSDLHIGKSGCSTIPESFIYGLPNIEVTLEDKHSKLVLSKDHINLGFFNAPSFKNLTFSIDEIINKKIPQKTYEIYKKKMKRYIENYFYVVDGKRCFEYANKIDNFLKNEQQSSSSKLTEIVYRSMNFIKDLANKYVRKIFKKYYTYTLIDKRGRYDSRIQLYEEYKYYSKFDKLNLKN